MSQPIEIEEIYSFSEYDLLETEINEPVTEEDLRLEELENLLF